MKDEPIMFKILFRDELYTLEQVRDMIKKNPDLIWVVYQVKKGTHKGERANMGSVDSQTLVAKYG
jgi:hypothetical protein